MASEKVLSCDIPKILFCEGIYPHVDAISGNL